MSKTQEEESGEGESSPMQGTERRKSLAEGKKKTRGENGIIGVIDISLSEEKEEKRENGSKEPNQKGPSGDQRRRRREEKGAQGMRKIDQLADLEKDI